MIFIGKAPYRISLLGGGSDLDWFVNEEQYGLALGYSLNMYSYSVLNQLPRNSKFGTLNYSSREIYKNNDEIVHPLIREAFNLVNLKAPVELSTYGSASGGQGMGGSSSFLISLLSALSKFLEFDWDQKNIAKKACEIEIDKLFKPIGRQDQYLCALGGISCLRFENRGKVINKTISNEMELMLKRLIKNFYLIQTNTSRKAEKVLSSIKNDYSSVNKLKDIRKIACDFIESQETRGHVLETKFHASMRSSWEIKRSLSNVMNPELEDQYNFINNLIPNNWIRLLGAGGGGFFLVSVKEDCQNIETILNTNNLNNFKHASLSEKGLECSVF